MADFKPGQTVTTQTPTVEVTVNPSSPLPPGRHRFELVVLDDSGNASAPDQVDIIVRDTQKPTAVLDAPKMVAVGSSFSLSGARSSDVPPGKIVSYRWTLIPP